MGLGTGATALIAGGISTAGSIASGAIGAHAAGKAADAQVAAANHAADLQKQEADASLAFQKQQYADSVARFQPWVKTGTNAMNMLNFRTGMGPNPFATGTGPTGPMTPSNPTGTGSGWGAPDPNSAQNVASNRSLPNRFIPPGFNLQGQNPSSDPVLPAGMGSNLGPNRFTPAPSPVANGNPQNGTSGGVMTAGGPANAGSGWGAPDPNSPQNTASNNGISANGDPAQATVPMGQTFADGGTAAGGGQTPQGGGSADGFGDLTAPWTEQFNAPTDITEQNDPGFQARLKIGNQLLQQSAAAKGGLMTGGTAKSLDQFGQDYASNEYGNVYNRAAGEFAQRYNIFKGNQNDIFNKYATLAGMGEASTSQLGSIGLGTGNSVGNTYMTLGNQLGNDYNNAGAARASGYVGGANAIGGAVSGGTNSIANLLALYALKQNQPAPGGNV